jgi:DeoR family ulaG and ulaABCDEF operon transcriptional repressor
MRESNRERKILDYLKDNTFASVKDLKQILNASDATIRRDISKLHESGALLKVFGGVAPRGDTVNDRSARPFSENKAKSVDKKRGIAKAAASLCANGDSIIVNGGSTAYTFAREISDMWLRVFTNSMPVAAYLWEHSDCHLTLAGGDLYREPGILYGDGLSDQKFFASKFFLGAQAFGPEGVMESNPLLVEAIGGLMEKADEVIVLCDSTKFDLRARLTACPIERIGTVITDSGIDETNKALLNEQGIRVIITEN